MHFAYVSDCHYFRLSEHFLSTVMVEKKLKKNDFFWLGREETKDSEPKHATLQKLIFVSPQEQKLKIF